MCCVKDWPGLKNNPTLNHKVIKSVGVKGPILIKTLVRPKPDETGFNQADSAQTFAKNHLNSFFPPFSSTTIA
jgi:hypothetical protein